METTELLAIASDWHRWNPKLQHESLRYWVGLVVCDGGRRQETQQHYLILLVHPAVWLLTSKGFNITRNHACACKFQVRPKIPPMQDCHQKPISSTSDLWRHGIDSCNVSFVSPPICWHGVLYVKFFKSIDLSHDFDTCVHMLFCTFSLAENVALTHYSTSKCSVYLVLHWLHDFLNVVRPMRFVCCFGDCTDFHVWVYTIMLYHIVQSIYIRLVQSIFNCIWRLLENPSWEELAQATNDVCNIRCYTHTYTLSPRPV